MKILVTNDDGIQSPGLWAAVSALKGAGDIFVVAPDRDQSGVGTSLTLHAPVRASEISPTIKEGNERIRAYSVEGTPADSCVLALERLVGPVDLVVSGINQGSNLGEDILISGTVGAALQGYVRGYPSIAISVAEVKHARFDVAAGFLKILTDRIAEGTTLPATLINVNVPNEPSQRIEGVQITRLGRRSYGESVTEREDGRHKYYWVSRDRATGREQDEDSDIWAIRHNRISVTPIHTGLTNTAQIPLLVEIFRKFPYKLDGDCDEIVE